MIYPMFALVILTFIISLVAIRSRVAGVRKGAVKIQYFQLMSGADVPDIITKSTRCFNNMFEIPVLFYTVSILYIIADLDSLLGLVLAWTFVVFRYLQAFIHLTYNKVLHRMLAFWLAFLAVMGLWINLLLVMNPDV